MTDDERLLRASIAADPRERTPRLALADLLDEQRRHIDAALERVLAIPEDDALRLAMAAALEAEADRNAVGVLPDGRLMMTDDGNKWMPCAALRDRAEFIRVQVELANWTGKWGSGWEPGTVEAEEARRCLALHGRERDLASRMRHYLLDMGVQEAMIRFYPIFRRGFAETIRCQSDEWVRHGNDILAQHPVQSVTLTSNVNFDMNNFWISTGAPRGWKAYQVRGRKTWWSWETLGKPEFAPTDMNALARRLMECEYPTVKFLPSQVGSGSGSGTGSGPDSGAVPETVYPESTYDTHDSDLFDSEVWDDD